VEQSAVLWRQHGDALRRLEAERPELARTFTALVLKCVYCSVVIDDGSCDLGGLGLAAKFDFDILLSALATRQ